MVVSVAFSFQLGNDGHVYRVAEQVTVRFTIFNYSERSIKVKGIESAFPVPEFKLLHPRSGTYQENSLPLDVELSSFNQLSPYVIVEPLQEGKFRFAPTLVLKDGNRVPSEVKTINVKDASALSESSLDVEVDLVPQTVHVGCPLAATYVIQTASDRSIYLMKIDRAFPDDGFRVVATKYHISGSTIDFGVKRITGVEHCTTILEARKVGSYVFDPLLVVRVGDLQKEYSGEKSVANVIPPEPPTALHFMRGPEVYFSYSIHSDTRTLKVGELLNIQFYIINSGDAPTKLIKIVNCVPQGFTSVKSLRHRVKGRDLIIDEKLEGRKKLRAERLEFVAASPSERIEYNPILITDTDVKIGRMEKLTVVE